ncbi:8-oxo-dGTP pyrophosphatase MutT (NUDIX family) [Cryobacterium mesophilum]|uniref:NUDIX hydrolase n=1 Tax=Terrimesophilobacter mesophilus TaxID=433647 RepID=UPI00185353BA|nr:NUDIX domain-containing protein [Terrimesophilobacter mesophilus]MBB5633363.1 8-oxo-dGTP pyrophosphatase MutT (NUDIX family) [Terrimesophilobacter mesophilus]
MTTEDSADPVPRSSATVLLLRDDPFEVLLVTRAARGAFASALVFPGGAIDPGDHDPAWRESASGFDELADDERALRIGAVREVWEETGILLADGPAPVRDGREFRDAVTAAGARIRLDALTHFGHWITPIAEARRFDTHFFLAAVSPDTVAVPDGAETLVAEWMPPAVALALAQSGERPIIFPTMMNLARLAESGSSVEALAAARARSRFTVQPEIVTEPDGARRITILPEAGYPVTVWQEYR